MEIVEDKSHSRARNQNRKYFVKRRKIFEVFPGDKTGEKDHQEFSKAGSDRRPQVGEAGNQYQIQSDVENSAKKQNAHQLSLKAPCDNHIGEKISEENKNHRCCQKLQHSHGLHETFSANQPDYARRQKQCSNEKGNCDHQKNLEGFVRHKLKLLTFMKNIE